MERHASALKAARQSEKRRLANQVVREECKTIVKKVRKAITEAAAKNEAAIKELPAMIGNVQRKLMKAASKNVIERGKASRLVSRLSKAANLSQK